VADITPAAALAARNSRPADRPSSRSIMAPKGKSVSNGTQFVRIKVAACQYAKYEFSTSDNAVVMKHRGDIYRETVIRRNASALTIGDVWEAMKLDKQKIKLDINDSELKLTTDQERTVPLEDAHEIQGMDTCLALGYLKKQPTKKKSAPASSSSAATESHATLLNEQAEHGFPTRVVKNGNIITLAYATDESAETALKELAKFYSMEDQMNATIIEQIAKLKKMLVKKGPAAAAAAATEDDDEDDDEDEDTEEEEQLVDSEDASEK
jgi:hypothetical protein